MTLQIDPHLDSLVPGREVTRRGFVVTSLGAGFAAAVLPVSAQTMIVTSDEGLTAGAVKIPTKDGEMIAYRAMPATGGNFPVVLVISEIWGVHDHITDMTRRFAKLGYFAIAPELFARAGDPRKIPDIGTIIKDVVAKTPDAQVLADLDATVAFAKASGKADAAKLGITGFCWGGRVTLMYAAHNPDVKAAIAWYGSLGNFAPGDKKPIDVAAQIKAPLLALYGGADSGIPNPDQEKMRDAVKAGGNANVEWVIYPDTPHAFNADYRPTYRKPQAEDAWKRAAAWFKKYLG
jgi:carboxymethylenebutenolidase